MGLFKVVEEVSLNGVRFSDHLWCVVFHVDVLVSDIHLDLELVDF